MVKTSLSHCCLCLGGAFYTPETIDTARLHYRSSWAPVLHAVALWLSSTGFGAGEEELAPAVPQAASSTTKTFEESVKDRMHLMLGKETHIICCTVCSIHVTVFFVSNGLALIEVVVVKTQYPFYRYSSKNLNTYS